MRVRACETCARWRGKTSKCAVLKEPVGLESECWAWTDDPDWEEKAERATRDYALRVLESAPLAGDDTNRKLKVLEANLYLLEGKLLK